MNFAESLVGAALQSIGYLVIQGIKIGVREIDFLAVKKVGDKLEYFHIEVSISYHPIGVLRKHAAFGTSGDDIENSASEYIDKKFFQPKVCQAIKLIFGTDKYKKMFIHGRLKDYKQLEVFKKKGVGCLPLRELIKEAENSPYRTNGFVNFIEVSRIMLEIK